LIVFRFVIHSSFRFESFNLEVIIISWLQRHAHDILILDYDNDSLKYPTAPRDLHENRFCRPTARTCSFERASGICRCYRRDFGCFRVNRGRVENVVIFSGVRTREKKTDGVRARRRRRVCRSSLSPDKIPRNPEPRSIINGRVLFAEPICATRALTAATTTLARHDGRHRARLLPIATSPDVVCRRIFNRFRSLWFLDFWINRKRFFPRER